MGVDISADDFRQQGTEGIFSYEFLNVDAWNTFRFST